MPVSNEKVERVADGHYPPPIFVKTSLLRRIVPFVPIVAALVELPWLIEITLIIFGPSNNSTDHTRDHQVAFLGSIPAFVGLVAGIYVLARRMVRRPLEWIFFVIGWAVCGCFVFDAVWQLCR